MAGMLYVIKFYLKSSIEIRRVEAMNRSPVMSHIAATLAGLTTIRASRQVFIYCTVKTGIFKCYDDFLSTYNLSFRWLFMKQHTIKREMNIPNV